jgi:hypothetical protein
VIFLNIKVKFLTRTAILLALAIVFQMMGRFLGPNNNFIVGPLVNAVLIVSTAASGLWGGTAISVIAPLVSALTNKAPIAPIILSFSPFIAGGNFIFVLCYHLFAKRNKIAGVAIGSVLKFAFLFASITIFTGFLSINPKQAAMLTVMFGWPQLLTALIGGTIALVVIKAIGRNIEL